MGLLFKVVRVGNFQLALRGGGGFYVGQQAGILGLFQDLSNIVQDALVRVQQSPTLDLSNTLAIVNAVLQSSQAQQSTSVAGSTAQHLVALGLYYSGRADFQLGMVGYTLLGQLPLVGADGTVSGKPQDGGVQLVFHYIW